MNHARVRSGMMFAAVPPSWMIPWTRQCGGSCWRHRPTLENSAIIASRALRPSHGSDDACDCSPWNTTDTSSDASGAQSTWLRSQGWYRRAASRPSNSPSSIMNCLPLPRSSAGRAEEHDLARERRPDAGERDRRAHARCRHRVVPAAMPEAGQRVVLGEHADPRPVRPEARRRAAPGPPSPAGRPAARRRTRGRPARPRPMPRPDAPRTRAPGWRGSGATGRGSRRGRPRPPRRHAP